MSHTVTINTDDNQVTVQTGASNEVVQVNTSGPQGPPGAPGPSGSDGASGSQGPAGTVTINSGVTAGGDILPDTANAYDIGSADFPFKDLYLSSSTLFLGNTKLSTDEQGGLTVVASGSNTPLPSNLSGSFTGSYSGSVISTDFTFDGETLNVLGDVFVQGTLNAATKNFKIQHPTMEGYYLVHSSLEGPERGIYHRGKLKVSNIIHLPDYWKDLPVDDVDITVQLTPIGNACQHFVKSINKEEIEVGCECGKPHCFYIVHAQRYNEGKFEILEPKKSKSL